MIIVQPNILHEGGSSGQTDLDILQQRFSRRMISEEKDNSIFSVIGQDYLAVFSVNPTNVKGQYV